MPATCGIDADGTTGPDAGTGPDAAVLNAVARLAEVPASARPGPGHRLDRPGHVPVPCRRLPGVLGRAVPPWPASPAPAPGPGRKVRATPGCVAPSARPPTAPPAPRPSPASGTTAFSAAAARPKHRPPSPPCRRGTRRRHLVDREPRGCSRHDRLAIAPPSAKFTAILRIVYLLAMLSASLRMHSRAGRSVSKVPSSFAAAFMSPFKKRPLIPSFRYAISAPWREMAKVAIGSPALAVSSTASPTRPGIMAMSDARASLSKALPPAGATGAHPLSPICGLLTLGPKRAIANNMKGCVWG